MVEKIQKQTLLQRTGAALQRTGGAVNKTGVALPRTGGAIERSIHVLTLEPAAAHTAGPLISVGYSQRYLCLGCLCSGGESQLYGIAQFRKYDPGAQCGIEYYKMYCKFARMQKY